MSVHPSGPHVALQSVPDVQVHTLPLAQAHPVPVQVVVGAAESSPPQETIADNNATAEMNNAQSRMRMTSSSLQPGLAACFEIMRSRGAKQGGSGEHPAHPK